MKQEFNRDKIHFNLARLKKGGHNFEVAIDPDLAIEYSKSKTGDLKEIIKSEHIFSDVKKGLFASEETMKTVFSTDDPLEIAKIILEEGEIQVSSEHRDKEREQKKNQIIEIIRRNAIDPKTNLPIPLTRIENAFSEAQIKIDNYKSAEDQLHNILDKLRPVLPIKMETKKIGITIPATYAGKSYNILKEFGKISKESWQNDGSLILQIEIPAGLQNEFFDKLNDLTHGEVDIKIID